MFLLIMSGTIHGLLESAWFIILKILQLAKQYKF